MQSLDRNLACRPHISGWIWPRCAIWGKISILSIGRNCSCIYYLYIVAGNLYLPMQVISGGSLPPHLIPFCATGFVVAASLPVLQAIHPRWESILPSGTHGLCPCLFFFFLFFCCGSRLPGGGDAELIQLPKCDTVHLIYNIM